MSIKHRAAAATLGVALVGGITTAAMPAAEAGVHYGVVSSTSKAKCHSLLRDKVQWVALHHGKILKIGMCGRWDGRYVGNVDYLFSDK